MRKPLNPKAHCLIDYGFVALQALVPIALGLSQKTTRRSRLMGAGVLTYSALTQSPVALHPLIPFKAHKWIDLSTLTLLAFTTMAKDIRRDTKAIAFNLGLVVLGATAVALTNWQAKGSS